MMRALVIILAFVVAPRTAGATCRAVVVLEGDAGLVDTLETALQRRGIATRAAQDCPTTKARIDRRDSAIVVSVVDAAGRSSERTLVDLDAAASLIESWARQDMNDSLLLGFIVPDAPAPVAEEVARDAPAPRTTRTRDPFTVVVAGESSFDGTDPWLGARATACVRVGRACVGGIGRTLANGDRKSIDALGGVELAFGVGARGAIVAGAAVGAGWFSSRYSQAEAMLTSSSMGPRIDGHAAFSYLLGRHVSLHVGISAGGSPSAPVTILDGGDQPLTNREPRGFIRADAGLRIGVP